MTSNAISTSDNRNNRSINLGSGARGMSTSKNNDTDGVIYQGGVLEASSSSGMGQRQTELSMSIHKKGMRPSMISAGGHKRRKKQSIQLQHNEIVAETKRTIDSLRRDSAFFHNNPPKSLPTFQKKELNLGQVIGQGEFGVVFEIKGFDIPSEEFVALPTEMARQTTTNVYIQDLDSSEFPTSLNNEQSRIFMQDHALRDGVARFAVKKARQEGFDDVKKETAAVDLAVEAKFLACLSHSNIIKLRATVSKAGHDNFMIILDRLYDVLDKRIERWKQNNRSNYGPFGLVVADKVEHFKGKTERLLALYDIARALKHMHSHKLLYRDLKPENIGIDVRGDWKIFDFGLCRELKKNDLKQAPDGYDYTGLTGSRRWMAPEVVLCKLYGTKADVYSYLPYERYDIKKHTARVVIGGERPSVRRLKGLSDRQRDAIVNGWDTDPSKRPSMEDFCSVLQLELVKRKQNIKKNQRRSTVAGILRRSQIMRDKSSLELGRVGEIVDNE